MKSAPIMNGKSRVKALYRSQSYAFLKVKTLKMVFVSLYHSVAIQTQWHASPAQSLPAFIPFPNLLA